MMIKDAAIPSEKSTAPAKAAQTARPSFHPNELLVRWEIAVRARDWSSAGAIAKALIVAQPAEPIGWIYHAFAQQQSGLIQEARQSLLTAAKRFPNDWRIVYNLACYTAQLGDLTGAWNWVKRAFELGGAAVISPWPPKNRPSSRSGDVPMCVRMNSALRASRNPKTWPFLPRSQPNRFVAFSIGSPAVPHFRAMRFAFSRGHRSLAERAIERIRRAVYLDR